jgi:putative transposase
LRQEFGHLKSSLPSLWSRSYFVGSAGTVTAATIKRYIASQQERG